MGANLLFKNYMVSKINGNFDLIKTGENSIRLSFSFSTFVPKVEDKKDCSVQILTSFSNNDNEFFSFEFRSFYTIKTDEKISTEDISSLLKETGFKDAYERSLEYLSKFCTISSISRFPMPTFGEVISQ